ncbi:class I SAM-dependent methyltransferase [Chromobacterium sphagni]|uniref:Methyltransferase type 11 domain-containing protein n=1 Tax=Chromobacterium sphagni TaxID=1903179 RepID=A0ABX3C925_9NEIS|nr:class I SAM-dependent methyltransferase [Chromobacterium sphagni]OHX17672.1 hypothetical protein BI344_20675 [Chromobacterium sphagni]
MASIHIADRCLCCGGEQLSAFPAVLMPFVAHRALGWQPVRIAEDWQMAHLQTGIAYSVCNTLYCRDCHFVFLDMRFDGEAMANLYRDYRGDEYVALRDHYEPGYAQRNAGLLDGMGYVDKVEDFIGGVAPGIATVLDYGGDTGINSPFRHRAEVFVYDISGCEVVDGARRLSRDELRRGAYDLIVLSNVLEHDPDPERLLREVCRYMDGGTHLYLEVPAEQLFMRFGEGWTPRGTSIIGTSTSTFSPGRRCSACWRGAAWRR